jgi:hypothetical protein
MAVMDLIQVGPNQFLSEFVSLATQEENLQPGGKRLIKRSRLTIYGPLRRERMNQISGVFALDHAVVFEFCDGIIVELERPQFDSGKPAFKAGEIQRILFAGVDQDHRAWPFELGAAAFGRTGISGCGMGTPSSAISTENQSVCEGASSAWPQAAIFSGEYS